MHIAVLGCGNMGRAIINGLVAAQPQFTITAYDSSSKATEQLPESVLVKSPDQWFNDKESPEAVLIAVKPQDIQTVAAELCACAGGKRNSVLWISIAAGVHMSSLANHFGDDAHLCRVMPNTPALIGEGVSAYALSSNCDEKDGQTVERVMGCCGKVLAVAETLLDAVTGVSGSGPAYVYRFIEALIEGGITAGLPPKIARECAVQTVIGAAKMVQCSQTEPAELKHNVMSAGGTTAYGLLSLEENGFAFSVMKAILAATERSRELGKK